MTEPRTQPAAAGATELRLVVTVDDFDDALAFYRDVLGLEERDAVGSEGGRIAILHAGHATLELADQGHAEHIDEVEVGRRVAGKFRVAFRVADTTSMTEAAEASGATVVAPPTPTPWGSLNSRLDAPGGLQLTLFGPG